MAKNKTTYGNLEPGGKLLNEDGSSLLNEDSSHLMLDDGGTAATMTTTTKPKTTYTEL